MIKVIDNFLSDEECNEYMNLIDDKSVSNVYNVPNVPNVSDIQETKVFKHKEINSKLSTKFFERFSVLEDLTKWNITGPNNLIKMSKYKNGQKLGIHTDTGLFYDKINKLKTRYTVLIYLNDNYENGHTVFYNDKFEIIKDVVPKKGSCLIFDIDLWHEGQVVKNGQKYWIGCEFIGLI